jgi:hypothetical protein
VTSRLRSSARALCAALCLIAVACSPHPSTAVATAAPSPSPAAPAYLIHGIGSAGRPVKLENIDGGRTVYDLKATDVFYSTSSSKGRFLNDTITFYKGSAVRLTVKAPVGIVDRTTYDFDLLGGVDARSAQGIHLVSDSMSYDGNTRLLTAIGHVRAVDTQGDVLVGDKAVADLDLQNIHMSGNVGIGGQ